MFHTDLCHFSHSIYITLGRCTSHVYLLTKHRPLEIGPVLFSKVIPTFRLVHNTCVDCSCIIRHIGTWSVSGSENSSLNILVLGLSTFLRHKSSKMSQYRYSDIMSSSWSFSSLIKVIGWPASWVLEVWMRYDWSESTWHFYPANHPGKDQQPRTLFGHQLPSLRAASVSRLALMGMDLLAQEPRSLLPRPSWWKRPGLGCSDPRIGSFQQPWVLVHLICSNEELPWIHLSLWNAGNSSLQPAGVLGLRSCATSNKSFSLSKPVSTGLKGGWG